MSACVMCPYMCTHNCTPKKVTHIDWTNNFIALRKAVGAEFPG